MPKFSVAESIHINASPERVFEVVSDFNTWTTWSPWLCAEPTASVEVTPSSNEVGSVYSWNGDVVGAGEIEHKKLNPGSRIEEDLRFLRPWKSQADVSFELQSIDGQTKLTWTMDSSLPWFMFWMKNMMVNMIGMDYARGLKMLKEHIETGQILSKTTVNGVQSVGPMKMVGVRKRASLSEIGDSMNEAIREAEEKLGQTSIPHEGQKIAVYHQFDMANRIFEYTAGVMVHDPDAEVDGLSFWSMPESNALSVTHIGSYENLGNAWSAAHSHLRHLKLKQIPKVGTFEIYRNEPGDTEPAGLITDIFLPVK